MLAGGAAIGQLLVAASTPLVTRLYSPSAFGLFSLYFTYVTFTATGTSLTYSTAIVSARSPAEAASLFWASSLLTVPTSVLVAVAMFLLVRFKALGFGALPSWTAALTVVSVALTGMFTTSRYWSVRQGYFGVISRSVVLQNAGRVLAQVGGGLLQPGLPALAMSDVIGRLIGVRKSGSVAFREARPRPARSSLGQVMATYRRFPQYYLPSTMLDNLIVWLPLPMIFSLYGASSAGYFGVVSRVVAVPLVLVGSSVADVFHTRIAEMARDGLEGASLMWKSVLMLLAAGALPTLVLWLLGPPLFALALGSPWRTAGAMASAMAPWILAQFCVNPVSRVVLVYNGQRLKLIYDVTMLIFTVASFAVARHLGLSVLHFVLVLSIGNVVGYLLYLALLGHLVARKATVCAE